VSGWELLIAFVLGALFGGSFAAWYMLKAIHYLGLSNEVAVRTIGSLAARAQSQESDPRP